MNKKFLFWYQPIKLCCFRQIKIIHILTSFYNKETDKFKVIKTLYF